MWAVQENVYVDWPWPHSALRSAPTSQLLFNAVNSVKQLKGGQFGRANDHGVQEAWLAGNIHWLSLIDAREAHFRKEAADFAHGSLQLAQSISQVGPYGQEDTLSES